MIIQTGAGGRTGKSRNYQEGLQPVLQANISLLNGSPGSLATSSKSLIYRLRLHLLHRRRNSPVFALSLFLAPFIRISTNLRKRDKFIFEILKTIYVIADGKRNQGLVNRREKEIALWNE